MASKYNESERNIRKLRKKLRQINVLEHLNRKLNDDEVLKIQQKQFIRTELLDKLKATTVPDVLELEIDNKNTSDIDDERPVDIEVNVKRKLSTTNSDDETKIIKAKKKLKSTVWKEREFQIVSLVGHNDLINTVSIDNNLVVSGSRDTTVKVWKIGNWNEPLTFGGHTEGVTGVIILSEELAEMICCENEDLQEFANNQIIISSSTDCRLRILHIESAKCIDEIYTFNPISKICSYQKQYILIATCNGKLELWNILEKSCITSINCGSEECITNLLIDGEKIWVACIDATLKCFKLNLDEEIKSFRILKTVDILDNSDTVTALAVKNDKLFYSDNKTFIHVFGKYSLINHENDFGWTDCLKICNDYLLASAFDIDHGIGFINVRSVENENYMFSLKHEDCGRILSMDCLMNDDKRLIIATGGFDLKIWLEYENNINNRFLDNCIVKSVYINTFCSSNVNSNNKKLELNLNVYDETDDDEDNKIEQTIYNQTDNNKDNHWNCCIV